jgi:RNA polymerase sigma-70 factor, ECF subfamily
MAINIEEFYTKYGPMVLRRCRSLLRDEERALDAMQDTFVQVIKKQNKLDARAPSSLLYTIATNICLNIIRSQKRRPPESGGDIINEIAGYDDPENRALSIHFLDKLFENQHETTRTIATLHYVDKMTLEETAEQVGMSVSGIRKRLRNLKNTGLALKEV